MRAQLLPLDGSPPVEITKDLIVVGRTPMSAGARTRVEAVAADIARETSFSSMMAFPKAGHLTRLVNVRATEGNYPFYGDFTTVPADAATRLRQGGDVVIIEETLLRQFDTQVGDTVKQFASDDATVVIGTVIDPEMTDEIRVTVVATGLGQAVGLAEKPMKVVRKVPPPVVKREVNFNELEKPAVQRKRAVGDGVTGNESLEDLLDIPAFLRRQAD